MIGYNPSHLNKNETLLEAFHRVEAYLKANPQYQVYQSSVPYQETTNEYTLNSIVVPEGSKVSTGDVVFFSNSYYAVITAVYELTFSVETAVSFRGPQGPKGDKGDKGDRGTGGAGSNPNLLINPNFAINQREQTSYTASESTVYCVDRWYLYGSGTFNTSSKEVSLLKQYSLFWQSIENYNDLKGKTVTFSISVSNVRGNALYMKVYGGQDIHITTDGIYTVTTTLSTSITKFGCGLSRSTNVTGEASCVVNWAKLEVGSVATEFSPPSIAEELPKCQRYYQRFSRGADGYGLPIISVGYASSTTTIVFPIALACSMRNTPTVTYSEIYYRVSGNAGNNLVSTVNSPVDYAAKGVNVAITVTGANGLTLGQSTVLQIRAGGYIAFDAEI